MYLKIIWLFDSFCRSMKDNGSITFQKMNSYETIYLIFKYLDFRCLNSKFLYLKIILTIAKKR